MIVGDRQGGLSISETADLLGFSHARQSQEFAENGVKNKKHPVSSSSVGRNSVVNERGQRRRARLVKADRKVTVTQITTHYNSGMQKSISEHKMRQTFKCIGYSSRRSISKQNIYNQYQIKCSLSVYLYVCPSIYQSI